MYELQSAWMEPRLAQYGVSWTTFQLLATVLGAGSNASQAEVANRLGVAPATLSESVTKHVSLGLLEQVPSSLDKRKKILQLTSQGKRTMGKVKEIVEKCEEKLGEGLKVQDRKTVARVLDHMMMNLERDLQG